MQTVYIGNTLVNDIFLGSQRMDDVFENPSVVFTTEYLVVAGGGRGANGTATRRGGGAGAGGLLSGSVNLLPNTIYQVQIGTNDNSTTADSYLTGSNAYYYSSRGGAGGTTTPSQNNGSDGGSGGGGGQTISGTTSGGTGIVGQGNNGAGGTTGNAGGGGGALSAGSGTTGGSGKLSSITGTSTTYAKGGSADVIGGDEPANTGNGGNGGRPTDTSGKTGGTGIVVVRYLGPQKATGGTVTSDGSYIVHTFTTTGTATLQTY